MKKKAAKRKHMLLPGPPLPHTDTIREDFGGTLENHGFRLIDMP